MSTISRWGGEGLLTAPPRAADYVIGGWGVQGLTTLMDGFPLGFTTGTNLTNSYGGGSTQLLAGCKKGIGGGATSKLSKSFNTDCFTAPPAFTFGDEPRNDPQLKSPGVANWDAAVVKSFPSTATVRSISISGPSSSISSTGPVRIPWYHPGRIGLRGCQFTG